MLDLLNTKSMEISRLELSFPLCDISSSLGGGGGGGTLRLYDLFVGCDAWKRDRFGNHFKTLNSEIISLQYLHINVMCLCEKKGKIAK